MRNARYYRPIKISASLATTVLAALFYYLNTTEGGLKEKISGIAVNLFVNYFMAETSIDFEASLIDDLKSTPADQLNAVLGQLGDCCLQLTDPFLFENSQPRDLEAARLLPGANL